MEESLNKYNENPEIKESWDSIQAQVYGIISEIRYKRIIKNIISVHILITYLKADYITYGYLS